MRSVLIVDDMPIFREPLEALFRGEGFSTRTASNGADALNIIADEPPDVIVLDLSMPGLCGTEFLKRLRKDARTATIPVIVLTAESDAAKTTRIMDLGVDGFLMKSRFSARELVTRVRAAARKQEAAAGDPSPDQPSGDMVHSHACEAETAVRHDTAASPRRPGSTTLTPLTRLDVSA